MRDQPHLETSLDSATNWLSKSLGLNDGETAFPWQCTLLQRFVQGDVARSLDIPTGLGKTAVMAIWLIARALNPRLPRRLVYVVDRRAVVDQATRVAEMLREYVEGNAALKWTLGLDIRPLPISTLRGQFVDNREWLEDPSLPAIIVGTVDMVGSRLLFEGYGTTRKMRPYVAGLLGADTLLVLDEAHLVPPFEKLLESIAEGTALFGPREEDLRPLIPPFKLLSLSATGRAHGGEAFTLLPEDEAHPVVRKRLDAIKRLRLSPLPEGERLADVLEREAWKRSGDGTLPARILVFCDKRDVAMLVWEALRKRAGADKTTLEPGAAIELLVGGRRIFERQKAADDLEKLGFIAGRKIVRTKPAFLIATSAGEVGVDLDADHMVSDLVAWERMVQRLGRVNRRGEGEATVVVVVEPPSGDAEKARKKQASGEELNPKEQSLIADADRMKAVLKLLSFLPEDDGAYNVSPGTLQQLKRDSAVPSQQVLRSLLDAATTPAPLRPALTRALVDAWSMTSLIEHTGRPEIAPWLRGWIDDDKPQTTLVWRTHLPVRTERQPLTPSREKARTKEIEAFFEAAPPHASEQLETETFRVLKWLQARAKAVASDIEGWECIGIILSPSRDIKGLISLQQLLPYIGKDAEGKRKQDKAFERLEESLYGATIVLDARLRGLEVGLLDHKSDSLPRTADDGTADDGNEWMAPIQGEPVVRFQVVATGTDIVRPRIRRWRETFRYALELSDESETIRWLIVENWGIDASSEEGRSNSNHPQLLDEHQSWAKIRAQSLAQRLALPPEYATMLTLAAHLHDEGKRSARWQRAFCAPGDDIYAKTRGPLKPALLEGYRHEFGSLPYAEKDARLRDLPEPLRDLALHLIAAHHGFARPVISTSGCADAPPSALVARAREVTLRFARLQKRWGSWGLAWWEALLRAADQQASRDNDDTTPTSPKEDP